MDTQTSGFKKLYAYIFAGAVIIIGGAVAFANGLFNQNSANPIASSTPTPTDTTTAQATATQSPPTTSGQKYANGAYSTTGSYRSPGGQEQFNISITLRNGTITQAIFTPNPSNQRAARFQQNFSQGFQQQVVGKNIDQVNVGVVNGASLTSASFMQALQTIRQKATI